MLLFRRLLVLGFCLCLYAHSFSQASMWQHVTTKGGDVWPVREDNILWIPFEVGGLMRYDLANNTSQFIDFLSTPASEFFFWQMGMDSNHHKWIANGNSLLEFDGFTWNKVALPPNFILSTLNVLPNGEVWANGIVNFFHFNGHNWETVNQLNGLTLAVGTQDGTLLQQDEDTIYMYSHYTNEHIKICNNRAEVVPLPSNFIIGYAQHGLLYGTDSTSTFKTYDGHNLASYTCPSNIFPSSIPVSVFGVDDSGNVYMSPTAYGPGGQNFIKYSPINGWSVINIPFSTSYTYLNWIYFDKMGEITLSTVDYDYNQPDFVFDSIRHWIPSSGLWQTIDIPRNCYETNSKAMGMDNNAVLHIMDKGHNDISLSTYNNCNSNSAFSNCPFLLDSIIANKANMIYDSLTNPWLVMLSPGNVQYLLNYKTCDTVHLGNNNITALVNDNYGRLYVLTNNATQNFVETSGNFVTTPIRPFYSAAGYRGLQHRAIVQRDSDFFYIGYNDTIYFLHNGFNTPVNFQALGFPSVYVRYMDIDSDKNVWVSTMTLNSSNTYFFKFNGNNWSKVDVPFFPIESFCTLANDVWFTTDKQVVKYDGVNWQTFPKHNQKTPTLDELRPRPDNKFWLICYGPDYGGWLEFDPLAPDLSYPTNIASGTAFLDLNNNSVYDIGDVPLQSQFLSAGINLTNSSSTGMYALNFNAQDTVISFHSNGYYYAQKDTFHISAASTDTGINFACHPIPGIKDLSVYLDCWACLSGYGANYDIICNNVGTDTLYNCYVSMLVDTSLTFVASDSSYNLNGDTLLFSVGTIPPGGSTMLSAFFNISPSHMPGQTVFASAVGYPLIGDTMLSNNYAYSLDTIVGSWDPNQKKVYPDGQIDTNQTLTYTIEFQNTGNAYAHRVVVSDTLDSNLDLNTLQVLGSSKNYEFSLFNNVLTVIFNNIMLPDSGTSFENSIAFLMFSIKPKHNLPLGAKISNTAYIYFDYNSPVKTNATSNFFASLITSTTSVSDNLKVNVYPNPMGQDAIVKVETGGSKLFHFVLWDAMGKKVAEREGAPNEFHLSRNTLSSGIYIYQVDDYKGRLARGKIVVW